MSTALTIHDIEAIADQIEREGCVVLKGVFPPNVIEEYRVSCEKQLKKAPRLEGKNYIPGVTPNYVQPWMINREERKIASTRLYEFYHNPLSENTKHIVDTVIALRDKVEERWPEIQEFNKKRQFADYNIIAEYSSGSGYQSVHSDLDPSIPHPTVQCEMILTQYGDDYTGGALILHLRNGKTVELHKEYDLHVGDLILFDKRIPHEVSTVLPGTGRNKGRWMALIGAKTFPRSDSRPFRDMKKKAIRFLFLRAPLLHDLLKKVTGRSTEYEETPMY